MNLIPLFDHNESECKIMIGISLSDNEYLILSMGLINYYYLVTRWFLQDVWMFIGSIAVLTRSKIIIILYLGFELIKRQKNYKSYVALKYI